MFPLQASSIGKRTGESWTWVKKVGVWKYYRKKGTIVGEKANTRKVKERDFGNGIISMGNLASRGWLFK
jgi:hypothetical protein